MIEVSCKNDDRFLGWVIEMLSSWKGNAKKYVIVIHMRSSQ